MIEFINSTDLIKLITCFLRNVALSRIVSNSTYYTKKKTITVKDDLKISRKFVHSQNNVFCNTHRKKDETMQLGRIKKEQKKKHNSR